jgi:hypothetical protein
MSIIPLDLQRRCEQRWAARFQRSVPPAAAPTHRLEKQDQQLAAPGKATLQHLKPSLGEGLIVGRSHR